MNRYETTLCYIYGPQGILMMHRTKKENDINKDKYIGVGGHLEHGESPEECVLREVKEETGLTMTSFRLRGIITFVIDEIDEITFLYTCDGYEGNVPGTGAFAEEKGEDLSDCSEGELVWIAEDKVEELPIWPGDKIFFRLLKEREEVFSLKLTYIKDELVDAAVDGKKIDFVV
ncbi:MAG: 8-oxo-dGTP diphosphatase [Clostridiales bacterium]|nr:8-oxo-dGTP diphosphatase [Clostridiales bacterium]